MAKKKYYVVWEGLQRGVFDSWQECEKQVKGYAGAKFKSFPSLAEAQEAFQKGMPTFTTKPKKTSTITKKNLQIQRPSLTVDAACSGNPGKLEYRGVIFPDNFEIFHQGTFPLGTVNIGEFLAIVHGLSYLKKHQLDWVLYSDSMTAIAWVRNKQIKTTLPENAQTKELFDWVKRAIEWLENNTYATQILKWETEQWGEIPADFGRK